MKRPFMLMILDGFGLSEKKRGNAIYAARKPNLDEIFARYPHTSLNASGLAVGLPDGQMGNSEVGHLNIGAGRVVYQELTRITRAIDEGRLEENTALIRRHGQRVLQRRSFAHHGAPLRRRRPQSHRPYQSRDLNGSFAKSTAYLYTLLY